MLNEFDHYLEQRHLCAKVRKHRYYWNATIDKGHQLAIQQDRQRKPTFSYCRYADDCVPRALNAASAAGGARCT